MARRIVLIAAMALCGCGPAGNAGSAGNASRLAAEVPAASLPSDHSTGFRHGYLLKVPRQGDFLWNGQPVGDAVLRDYLRHYARVPDPDDRLSVAFELGCSKPAERFYRSIEARTGFRPQDLFLVDDLIANVEGAIMSGWAAALWTGKDTMQSLIPGRQ